MCATYIEVQCGGTCTVLSYFPHWWLFLKFLQKCFTWDDSEFSPQQGPVLGFSKICLGTVFQLWLWYQCSRTCWYILVRHLCFHRVIFSISLCTMQINHVFCYSLFLIFLEWSNSCSHFTGLSLSFFVFNQSLQCL